MSEMTEQTPSTPDKPRWRWLVWAFAAVGVAAALALIWLVATLNRSEFRQPPAQVAAQTKGEVLEIGAVSQLRGTNLIKIDVGVPEDRLVSGSYKGNGLDLRNALLLDQTTGETHRLLPDNRTRILSIQFFPTATTNGDNYDASDLAAKDQPPAYYVLQLARGQGEQRRIGLLVGELRGYRQAVVLEGLEAVERTWMIDSRQLGLIVLEKQQMHFKVVDIPAQKVVRSQRIQLD